MDKIMFWKRLDAVLTEAAKDVNPTDDSTKEGDGLIASSQLLGMSTSAMLAHTSHEKRGHVSPIEVSKFFDRLVGAQPMAYEIAIDCIKQARLSAQNEFTEIPF